MNNPMRKLKRSPNDAIGGEGNEGDEGDEGEDLISEEEVAARMAKEKDFALRLQHGEQEEEMMKKMASAFSPNARSTGGSFNLGRGGRGGRGRGRGRGRGSARKVPLLLRVTSRIRIPKRSVAPLEIIPMACIRASGLPVILFVLKRCRRLITAS